MSADAGDPAAGADPHPRLRRVAGWLCALGYLLIVIAALIRFLSEGHYLAVTALVVAGLALESVALCCALPVFGTWTGRIVVYASTMAWIAIVMLFKG